LWRVRSRDLGSGGHYLFTKERSRHHCRIEGKEVPSRESGPARFVRGLGKFASGFGPQGAKGQAFVRLWAEILIVDARIRAQQDILAATKTPKYFVSQTRHD